MQSRMPQITPKEIKVVPQKTPRLYLFYMMIVICGGIFFGIYNILFLIITFFFKEMCQKVTPRLKACFQKKNGTRVLCIFLETRRHAGTGNMKIKIIRWGIFEKNDIENCNYHHFWSISFFIEVGHVGYQKNGNLVSWSHFLAYFADLKQPKPFNSLLWGLFRLNPQKRWSTQHTCFECLRFIDLS